jgi:hypothetical protein
MNAGQPDFGAELPGYEDQKHHPFRMDTGEGLQGEAGRSDNGRRDKRSEYALTVQKACSDALQHVKRNNLLVHSNWAAPLSAAPTAISVMAICLKTAAEKQAAGLEIEDKNVKDEKGEIIGTLPLDSSP